MGKNSSGVITTGHRERGRKDRRQEDKDRALFKRGEREQIEEQLKDME